MNRHSPGYTLLELVVVMAILAMATAMVAPAGYRMIRAWQEATAVDDLLQQIASLPEQVRASGNPLDTANSEKLPIALPDGWTLQMTAPLRVMVNGACSNARGTLATGHQTVEFQIQAPFCRIRRIEP